MTKLLYEEITGKIIAAAMEVHRTLGSGFLEAVYAEALAYELKQLGLNFVREQELKIRYKTVFLEKTYRADYIVENCILVENKATNELTKIDEAQMFNYLKVTDKKVGLLFNYGKLSLEWKRVICEQYKRNKSAPSA
ncbi:MAG: GxxExxY protein [Planctomycetota bacterium]